MARISAASFISADRRRAEALLFALAEDRDPVDREREDVEREGILPAEGRIFLAVRGHGELTAIVGLAAVEHRIGANYEERLQERPSFFIDVLHNLIEVHHLPEAGKRV